MRRAARIISSATQSVRSSPITGRCTLPPACIPGPSRLASRFISSSAKVSTLQAIRPIRPTPNPLLSSGDSDIAADLQLEQDDLPDNVILENIDRELDRGLEERGTHLHTVPSDLESPILLPVSSLASANPTLASSADIVVELPRDIFAQPLRRDILHRCVVWYQASLRSGTKKTKGRSEVSYSGRKLRPQKGSGRARLADRSNPMLKGGAHAHPIQPRDWSQLLPRKLRSLGMRIALSAKLDMGMLRVVQSLNEGGWTKTQEAFKALTDGKRLVPLGSAEREPRGRNMEGEMGTPAHIPTGTVTDSIRGEITPQQSDLDLAGTSTDPVDEDLETAFERLETEDKTTVQYFRRFAKSKKDLSILFVHAPSKSDTELWHFGRVIRNIPGVEMLSTDEIQVFHVLKYRWLVLEGDAIDAVEKRFASKPQVIVRIGTEREPRPMLGDFRNVDATAAADGPIEVKQGSGRRQLTMLPRGWAIRAWRKPVGAKRIEKAIGPRRARELAKRAKKEERHVKRKEAWVNRTRQWQKKLSSMEYEALNGV